MTDEHELTVEELQAMDELELKAFIKAHKQRPKIFGLLMNWADYRLMQQSFADDPTIPEWPYPVELGRHLAIVSPMAIASLTNERAANDQP